MMICNQVGGRLLYALMGGVLFLASCAGSQEHRADSESGQTTLEENLGIPGEATGTELADGIGTPVESRSAGPTDESPLVEDAPATLGSPSSSSPRDDAFMENEFTVAISEVMAQDWWGFGLFKTEDTKFTRIYYSASGGPNEGINCRPGAAGEYCTLTIVYAPPMEGGPPETTFDVLRAGGVSIQNSVVPPDDQGLQAGGGRPVYQTQGKPVVIRGAPGMTYIGTATPQSRMDTRIFEWGRSLDNGGWQAWVMFVDASLYTETEALAFVNDLEEYARRAS